MTGPVRDLHDQVVAALQPHGTVTVGATSAAGPCYAVAPPSISAHEPTVCGDEWTLSVDVLVIPPSARNRAALLDMVDTAAQALARLGVVTGSPGSTPYLDADLDTYTLTLEV